MKALHIFLFFALSVALVSCDPREDRKNLPEPVLKSELKFSVTQKQGYDNIIMLESKTLGSLAYWDYGTGTTNKMKDTINLPFAGQYWIRYTALSGGGPVTDSVQVKVSQNDPEYFKDQRWAYLTNGTAGKTWVLDMSSPIGWYGTDYLLHNGSSNDWSYQPDYAGNTWVMENKDWGYMNFSLNGGANYSKVTYDASSKPVTSRGSFNLDLVNQKIRFTGADLFFGGDYRSHASNWTNVFIFSLTANKLMLGVLRDNAAAGGPAYIVFSYKPKP
ncbi:hypothetical protein KHS38_02520 [Mucilaginibacter sp. Bleaf8]|uniref:hypothetical protein n=1 Tax=Mucilaginibacter sp. Bleaf8 TaxID=2834430 RepID=UPI001BCD767F|nr:hypothetical protein [Mucilaginibacter sp. Bleaf8]MBS7563268.1 hypothetical protein [Mucilaginibacter sp. Bleaf8]